MYISGVTIKDYLYPAAVSSSYSVNTGGGNKVQVANNASICTFSGDFTIEAWVYVSSNGNGYTIFNYWDGNTSGSGARNSLSLTSGTNSLGFGGGQGGVNPTWTTVNSISVSLNTWYHVAFGRYGSTYYIYFNGTLYQTASNATWAPTYTPLVIGAFYDGYTTGTGYISNFRIVNGTSVYTTAFTPPTSPLTAIANTTLLTCQNATLVDNSSNHFTISTGGSPTVSNTIYPSFISGGAVGTGGITVYEIPYVAPTTTITLSALLVGGGGGGGYWGGGGGGAGGIIYNTNTNLLLGVAYTVTIGGGGIGGTSSASTAGGTSLNGGSTVFNNLTAIGGGGGFGNTGSPSYTTFQAANGGSGGGVGVGSVATVGSGLQPSSTSGGFGNTGGNSTTVSPYPGGAGGGAGAAGGTGTGSTGGAGGIGITNALLNLTQVGQLSGGNYYLGGGGGAAGTTQGATAGAGGLGGGGAGSASGAGTAGTVNTGGGGGGPVNGTSSGGGAGGSGIAILASSYVAAVSSLSGSPTITKSNSNYIYKFTTTGALTYTNNTFLNYAASFNGSNQYLTLPINTALNFGTGNFTVEGWIYPNALGASLAGQQQLFVAQGTSSFTFSVFNNTIHVAQQNIIDLYNFTSSSFVNNAWYHVAICRSGTNMYCYLNGTQIGTTQTDSTNFTGTTSGTLGSGVSTYFNGFISNFRVVKGTALYTSNFTPSTTHLTAVSGTQLLTCQDAALVDNSTNNFTITNNNSVTTTYTTVPFNY